MLVNHIEDLGNRALNAVMVPLLKSRWKWTVQPFIATTTYTGRRSGKTFSTPVLYRQHSNVVTVRVAAPEAKQWWRNFLNTGAPITIQLREANRTGHATALRDDRGQVKVRIELDPPPTPNQRTY